MTSGMLAILSVGCITGGIWLFFNSTYSGLANYGLRKFWSQAEKVYLNFELMFMDQTFTLVRCKLLLLLSTGVGTLAVWTVTRTAPSEVVVILVPVGAIIGWFLPGFITSFMHKRYVRNFNDQLLDGVSMLGGSLSAGLSLAQALDMVGDQMPQPLSQEFKLLLNEYKYGISLDEAMDRMAQRVPSADLGIVIESILILRSTGANLVETFDIILFTIRERKRIEEKIKTMTSMGVAQAAILLSMPFVLMFALNKLNPKYMVPLFATQLGWAMLVLMIIMMSLGAFLIKKIITIDV